jgi:hypothetical protein
MESVWKPNYLIGLYFSIMLVLLLCVSTTPLLIRHGIAITDRFLIEEEVLETIMILVLFGISFLVLIRMINRLNSFRQTAERAVYEKSRLISRLAEAFRYIGRVNVEIQEIESALCGVAFYPQSKKEFRALVDKLASKATTGKENTSIRHCYNQDSDIYDGQPASDLDVVPGFVLTGPHVQCVHLVGRQDE